ESLDVYGIVEDDAGSLWFSTNSGLRVLNPTSDQIRVYSARDGLQGNEFAQGAYFRGAHGTLYFGGPDGATTFEPTAVGAEAFSPPLVLTGFRIFGEPQPLPSQGLELSYRDTDISFGFAALGFADPRRIQYEYTLGSRWVSTRENSI